jgi:hypothetical protein
VSTASRRRSPRRSATPTPGPFGRWCADGGAPRWPRRGAAERTLLPEGGWSVVRGRAPGPFGPKIFSPNGMGITVPCRLVADNAWRSPSASHRLAVDRDRQRRRQEGDHGRIPPRPPERGSIRSVVEAAAIIPSNENGVRTAIQPRSRRSTRYRGRARPASSTARCWASLASHSAIMPGPAGGDDAITRPGYAITRQRGYVLTR